MKFLIVTHVEHLEYQGKIYAYGPYVREMNLWSKHVEEILIVCPIKKGKPNPIDLAYRHEAIRIYPIPSISLISFFQAIRALVVSPFIMVQIFLAMRRADHIHLRCPGNIGLLGCLVQVLFPKKKKTAKYAGNWDPNSQQPRSYRWQKRLLSSTFWTKNMRVLVYGDWPNQTKNILPFFTASYHANLATDKEKSFKSPFSFLFVGGLVSGKRPLYAVQLIEALRQQNFELTLDFYGDGVEREALESYVQENELSNIIHFHGNQPLDILSKAYARVDFLVLASRSEGWPKAVAEAMFWGAIPIATPISCLPWMLGDGERGVLLEMDLEVDVQKLIHLMGNFEKLNAMSKNAKLWSQEYTLDRFESEISNLLA